jgi:hypothetical protein
MYIYRREQEEKGWGTTETYISSYVHADSRRINSQSAIIN